MVHPLRAGGKRRADELLKLEHAVNRCLAEAGNLHAGLEAVLRAICESQGWAGGRCFLVDEAAGVLRFTQGWSNGDPAVNKLLEQSRAFTFKRGQGLSGAVWQSGEPLWVRDIARDRRTAYPQADSTRGGFLVPLMAEGKVTGVFSVISPEVREPDMRLLQAMRVIGGQVGQFVRREQAEAAMRASEGRFRALTQLSSDIYWEQDTEYRFTSFISTPRSPIGTGRHNALIGKKRWEQGYVNMTPADWKEHIALLDARQPFHELELCRLGADGENLWIKVSGEPMYDAAGAFAGYRGVGEDITARKRSELRVQRLTRLYAALGEANEAILQLGSPRELFQRACEIVIGIGGLMVAVVRMIDQTGEWLDQAAASGEHADYAKSLRMPLRADLPDGRLPTVVAVREGRLLVINDYQNEPSLAAWSKEAAKRGMRSAVICPLRRGGKVIGSFNVIAGERDFFDQEIVSLLERMCSNMSFALDGMEQQRERRESEERFRSLTNLSSDWYWEQDEQFRFTLISDADRRSSPWGSRSLGMARWEQPNIETLSVSWAEHRAMLEAHQPFHEFEYAYLAPDGSRQYVAASGEPMFTDGRFTGYRGVAKNITARRSAEAELRASEERFRSLTNLSSDWFWQTDAEHRFVATPQRVTAMTGLTAQSYVGKCRWEVPGLTPVSGDWDAHREVLSRRESYRDLELVQRRADGSLAHMQISGEPVFGEAGEFLGYRGTGRDVTEARRRERELSESEERFRSLTNLSSDWYWELDADLRYTTLRGKGLLEAEKNILGKRREDLPGMNLDTPGWKEHHALLAARKPFRDFVYERVDPTGAVRYISVSGEPIFDAAGQFAGYRGTGREVTEQRRHEQDLQRFRMAMDLSGDLVLLIDRASMRYIDVNETACRLLGYTRDELLSMGPQDLVEGQSRAVLEQAYDGIIANQAGPGSGTSNLRRADGTHLPVEFTRHAFRSGERWVIAALSRDISERLAAEEALRKSNERFDLAVRATNDIISDWNVATGEVWWNENLAKVLGWGDEVPRTVEAWVERVHPEDREAMTSAAKRAFKARSSSFENEYRVQRADGSYAHMLDCSHILYNAAGKPVRMIGGIADISARKDAESRLSYLAQFDTVTGLPNRFLFLDRLSQMLTQAKRSRWLVGVMFVDLDRFKAVNDTLGHAVGDKLLTEVGARLRELVRTGDSVGRLSGDEFALALSNLAKADDAALVAQKVVQALSAAFVLDGHQVYISASIGIAIFPGDGEESDALLKNADTAMYRAKEQGRNNYQFFLPQMNERLVQRLSVEADLRVALERNEFLLHYQPKVNLASGAISGFEALLRWQRGDKLVSPAEFVPVLEDTGLIGVVGEWVIRTACRQLRDWQAQGLAPRPVAINLSARQFQNRNLAGVVSQILRDTGVSPDLIEFELTETLLMSDAVEAVQMLRELKLLGVRLAIDDFGTGYSSLTYLKRFPLDVLKIDRAFIRDATKDTDDATLTATIINLAHGLDLKVVAEGVETEAQVSFLRAEACDEMQGYYFARPMSPADCARWLREDRRLPAPESGAAPGQPILLIVDDSDSDRELLEEIFSTEGYRIYLADTASNGLHMLAMHGADVVISDQHMPGMRGTEFLNAVRKLYPKALRVLSTGDSDPETVTDAVNQAGIHKFLSKDWDAGRLRAEVRAARQLQR